MFFLTQCEAFTNPQTNVLIVNLCQYFSHSSSQVDTSNCGKHTSKSFNKIGRHLNGGPINHLSEFQYFIYLQRDILLLELLVLYIIKNIYVTYLYFTPPNVQLAYREIHFIEDKIVHTTNTKIAVSFQIECVPTSPGATPSTTKLTEIFFNHFEQNSIKSFVLKFTLKYI